MIPAPFLAILIILGAWLLPLGLYLWLVGGRL
jgi:hypothetical protein